MHRVKAHDSGSHCVAFNPLGTKIASGGSDGILKLWNTTLSKIENKILKVSNGPVSSIAFNSIGTMLAAGDCDSQINLINVKPQLSIVGKLQGH